MAQVGYRLPKLHVYFRTNKTAAEVRKEILGPLANGYESFIQGLLDAAGQTGLTAVVSRSRGKVYRDGNRWMVYLKCNVVGETNLTSEQIAQAWANRKANIKTRVRGRIESATFGGTELRFAFKRLDGREAEEET